MNKYTQFLYAVAAVLLLAGSVHAQTVSVGSASGVPGGQAVVQLDWDNNGNVYRSLQFDVNFDLGVLPSVDTSVCPIEPYITGYLVTTCEQRAVPNDNQVRLGLLRASGTIPAGNLGQLTFNIDSLAVPGTTNLTITGVVIEGDPVPTINNGQIQILGAAYSSAPPPGALDLGSVIQGDTDISANVNISNSGAIGTTLTGDCAETSDPGNVFSYSNTSFSILQGDPAHTVTVTCDSDGAIATHTGTMECTHNGDDTGEVSPAVYNLSCTITEGPQAAYGSAPAPGSVINMSADHVGDPISDETVVIDNIGDVGTTLSGECGLSGDPEITLTGGAFSVPAAGPNSVQTLSCDSGAEGDFTAQLSCSHNGVNIPTPATYTVNCSVGPLRPAIFGSNPAPGLIDITDGLDVVVGDTPPEAGLQISNEAVAPAQDLGIECGLSGDAEISVLPDISLGTFVDAGDSLGVTFTCATDTADTFTAIYSCDYVTDDSGDEPVGGSAEWTVSCDVREPEAVVQPQPAGGTTLTERVNPGGSAQYSVVFREIADEGVDGSVDCSLEDGTNFSILTALPDSVPAGGSLTVTVEGTDPDDGSNPVTDALLCTYTDTDNPEPGVDVRYPLVLEIGGESAIFRVTKDFTDDNPAGVMAHISCNTGLPLEQDFEIFDAEGGHVDFVVGDFEPGTMDCVITESGVPAGYTGSYVAGLGADGEAESISDGEDGCVFNGVASGMFTCEITNSANAATYTVVKDWVFHLQGGDIVYPVADVTITCDSEITGGVEDDGSWTKSGNLGDSDTLVAEVDVSEGPATCSASEEVLDSSVESSSSGCGEVQLSAGGSHVCTFTNTVFFEGIPTLNQYGLALLALLMLGVGAVGLRRFV